MEKKRFFCRPMGAPGSVVPRAELADSQTSRQLVSESEWDAVYFRSLEETGIFLNKPQIEAVRHYEGPLLTLAGAGTGKTSVLVCRTGYLMAIHNVDPRNILLVTFTSKAAGEMKERIAKLPGLTRQKATQVEARTFHSFFLKIIRSRGFNQKILSNERVKQITIKQILKKMGVEDTYQPETLISILSSYKMNILTVEDLPSRTDEEKEVKRILSAYESWKRETDQIDFDDILTEAYRLLKETPSLLKMLQARFRYIMVDEFQDTNPLQYELVKMLAYPRHNLFVVGDDDQTIFSFNGANNGIILNFDKAFPEAKTVTLDINYRSPNGIVGLGNTVIQHNKERKLKTLKSTKEEALTPQFLRPVDTDQEAEWVIEAIKEKVLEGKSQYRDIAILHRTASSSRAIFEQLTLDGIPFVSYGATDQTFYEQWPVKMVVSYLRLAVDHHHFEAMEDLLPTLFINRDQGMRVIRENEAIQPKKYPLIHLTAIHTLKGFQKDAIRDRIKLIKGLKDLEPVTAIKQIRSQFYDKYLEANDRQTPTVNKETLKEALDELETSAKRFKKISTFVELIDDMIRKNQEMVKLRSDVQADAVSLMTIHRSKGLEFPVVYLIGASDGILPHSTALEANKMEERAVRDDKKNTVHQATEEERRLCYVAITRAQEELYISSPKVYRGKKADVSTFLLQAYPGENQDKTVGVKEKERRTSQASGTKLGKPDSTERPKKTFLAWLCTSDSCHIWQKIITYEDTELEHKDCPLCQSKMVKGIKTF
ncbi:exodeoxyribonuclease V subunit gamma [Pullulanibacillus sp. KACC 23026]|uniref:UvrD-helicase domain-containing protein n=1 Tax=Pullulanibacillus sp. KACC 23026 TaxID=3028315 RepID=UPI0023B11E94|nr:UvrD-helicase domain-containing protein [Pullulanibacillus sp. KACC 23026]WEG11295.1 exodeoxyribonuclease V subunit gamma [Pullulanibacillus sp. KACC 23026]